MKIKKTKTKIALDDGVLHVKRFNDDGSENVESIKVSEMKNVKDINMKRLYIAEYIYLTMCKERDAPEPVHLDDAKGFGFSFDNYGHACRCAFEANILGVSEIEIRNACAWWAHFFDFTPDEREEVAI